jgi:hypothetical protein
MPCAARLSASMHDIAESPFARQRKMNDIAMGYPRVSAA